MARRTVTQTIITDDVDDKELPEGTQPITLTLNGDQWTIFLSDKHEGELRDALHKFTGNVEPTKTRAAAVRDDSPREKGQRGPNRSVEEREAEAKVKADRKAQRAEIIAWADANTSPDYKTPGEDKGRIPAKLLEAFYAANKDAERLYSV